MNISDVNGHFDRADTLSCSQAKDLLGNTDALQDERRTASAGSASLIPSLSENDASTQSTPEREQLLPEGMSAPQAQDWSHWVLLESTCSSFSRL